jgi:hypothetical protein
MVAFVQGAQGKIDQNIFKDQTTTVIIQKMRASRTRSETSLLQKMTSLDARRYGFAEAEKDLRSLFWSGSLLAGFLELAADTGNDAKQAKTDSEDFNKIRSRIPVVTKEELQLSKKVGDKFGNLKQVWQDNKTSPVGQAALDEVRQALTSLKVTIPDRATQEEIFKLLEDELGKAAFDKSKLIPLAKALGVQ